MKALAVAAVLALSALLAACDTTPVNEWQEVIQVQQPWGHPAARNVPNGCSSDGVTWAIKVQPWRQSKGYPPVKTGQLKTLCVTESKAKSTRVGQIWNG